MEAKKILGSFMDMVQGFGVEPGMAPRIFVPEANHTSQAELVKDDSSEARGVEASAMPAGVLEVAVPAGWKPGDKVPAQGPHGRIFLELPETCEAGTTINYQLRAAPDLLVEVPERASAGSQLNFERADGTRIRVEVPMGKRPGEQFEVRPPALMVLVPEGVEAGSYVVFRPPGASHTSGKVWFRAQVPSQLQLGRYFAARMPPPGKAQAPGSPGKKQSKKEKCVEAEEVALLNDTQPDVVDFDSSAHAAEDRAIEATVASSSDVE